MRLAIESDSAKSCSLISLFTSKRLRPDAAECTRWAMFEQVTEGKQP